MWFALLVLASLASCVPPRTTIAHTRQISDPVVVHVEPEIVLDTTTTPSSVVVEATTPRTCRREIYDLTSQLDDGVVRRRRIHAGSVDAPCPLPVPHLTVHVTLATGELLTGVTDASGVFRHAGTPAQLDGAIRSGTGDAPPADKPIVGPAATFDAARSHAAFAAMRALVNRCAATHGWGGIVKVRLAIDPTGIAAAASNFGTDAFKICVRDGARAIAFPASPGGQTLDVKYQIVLPR